MSDHSRIVPPSRAGRWVPCPGSAHLTNHLPIEIDEGDEDAGAEGTAAHWVAAEMLQGRMPAGIAPNGCVVTPTMLEMAAFYVADVVQDGLPIYVEQRVTASAIHAECYGTPDSFTIDTRGPIGVIKVRDFKSGFRSVPAVENWQGVCYMQAVQELAEQLYPNVTSWTFEFIIIQPRDYTSAGPLKIWRLADHSLAHFVGIAARSAAQIGAGAPCNTGPHCIKCSGRHACEAFTRASNLALDVSASAPPIELSAQAISVELTILNKALEILNARHDAIEANAMALIRNGTPVPGWNMEHGRGRLEWNQPVAEVLKLAAAFGVNLAKPQDVVTPTQALKMGIDESVIDAYSARAPGKAKLAPVKFDHLKIP